MAALRSLLIYISIPEKAVDTVLTVATFRRATARRVGFKLSWVAPAIDSPKPLGRLLRKSSPLCGVAMELDQRGLVLLPFDGAVIARGLPLRELIRKPRSPVLDPKGMRQVRPRLAQPSRSGSHAAIKSVLRRPTGGLESPGRRPSMNRRNRSQSRCSMWRPSTHDVT